MKKLLLISLLAILFACSGTDTTEPDPIADLTAASWELSFIIQDTAVFFTPDGVNYTIEFSDTGAVHGKIACNSFSAIYRTTPADSLEFRDVTSTLALCVTDPLGAMYLNGLDTAGSYEMEENKLFIYYNSRKSVMVYVAETE